ATVSNIVKVLSDAGLVETEAGAGRRGTTVRVARSAGLVAGVDFGHRHVRLALGDLSGTIVAETRRELSPTHTSAEGLDSVDEMLHTLLGAANATWEQVLSVGMGLPAPIGAEGLVTSSSILPGWVGVNAEEVVADHLGKPVHIDNDANLGALAEHRRGAGVGHETMVYLKISSGVGAGIIINGQLFYGGAGTAGEIGHLTIDANGPVCRCGSRGCLEAYASVGMVKEMLAGQYPDASFLQIVEAARSGDTAPLRVIEDAGSHLGWGMAMVANLINPTCLVVGGDMAQAGELLLGPIGTGIRRHALGSVSATMQIVTSHLQDRSSVVGALLLALDRTGLPLQSPVS
ncbi:MAG: ROK family protein, partial [Nocardioidaceae bacterium]